MIILQILKIIGLVLLYILLGIVLLLLLLLFWPYFYKVQSDNNDEIVVKANVSWFFHIVSVWVTYTKEEGLNYYAKVLGIKVYDKKKKDSAAEADDSLDFPDEDLDSENIDDTKSIVSDENIIANSELNETAEISENKPSSEIKDKIEEDKIEEDLINKDSFGEEILKEKSSDEINNLENNSESAKDDKKKKFSLSDLVTIIQDGFEKVLDFILDIPDKIEEITRNPKKKVQEWADTIIYYKKLFSSKGTEYVIDFLKKYVGMIIKQLLPYGSNIRVDFASTDPSTVATVMEIYGMLLPFLPKHTLVNPDFDKDEVKYDLKIKGKFFLFVIVYAAVRIILDKKVRRFYKLVKREK